MGKTLAVCIYSHLRTYEKTYENFMKNIIMTNLDDHWEIKIFIATWDRLAVNEQSHHNLQFNNRKLNENDITKLKLYYSPENIWVGYLEAGEHGFKRAFESANHMVLKYERENNIKFDYYLYTRPDVMFIRPLLLSKYIDECKKRGFLLKEHHVFAISNFFGWMEIAHPNYPAEASLCFYSNKICKGSPFGNFDLQVININYFLFVDCFLYREYGLWRLSGKSPLMRTMLNHSYLKANIAPSMLNSNIKKGGGAKSRIQNQLSYKLGRAMIDNSKSLWGYIRMPYVLSYIKDMHKKEQIAYNEKIKANPSLKLPPLESYPDYKEALKEKECLTYKLGEAMIAADKSPLKLGYLSLWFKCKNIQKEFKKR